MTYSGTLLNYLQAAWNLSSPVGTAQIIWSDGWFNPLFPYSPQITLTELASPIAQEFGSSGSVTAYYRPNFVVNVWVQVPAGALGTQEAQNAFDMKKETARIFRAGFPNYGGSLTPFKLIKPTNDGVPRHEIEKTPMCIRYEVSLVGVKENE